MPSKFLGFSGRSPGIAKQPAGGAIQQQQLSLPMLDLSFLQLYSHQIREEGLAAKLGPSAFTLYIVMRAYSQVGGREDGVCRLSITQMEKATGMARSTVAKCIKTLETEKLITAIKQSERSTKKYYLLDSFTDTATRQPVATVVYQPTQAAKVRAELEAWISGKLEKPSHPAVTLVQINQQITNNTNITVNVTLDASKVDRPDQVAPWIEEILASVKARQDR